MHLKKLAVAIGAVTLVAGSGTAHQVEAAPNQSLPINIVGVASGPIDLETGGLHTTGVFVSPTLGPGRVIVDADGITPFHGVFKFRRGGQLFVTNDPSNAGPPLPKHCPTTIGVASGPYAGAEFITGGTDQFEGVTGYITYTGCLTITEDARSSTGFTFTFTFNDHGTISL
jgi:hypothetical protein